MSTPTTMTGWWAAPTPFFTPLNNKSLQEAGISPINWWQTCYWYTQNKKKKKMLSLFTLTIKSCLNGYWWFFLPISSASCLLSYILSCPHHGSDYLPTKITELDFAWDQNLSCQKVLILSGICLYSTFRYDDDTLLIRTLDCSMTIDYWGKISHLITLFPPLPWESQLLFVFRQTRAVQREKLLSFSGPVGWLFNPPVRLPLHEPMYVRGCEASFMWVATQFWRKCWIQPESLEQPN